MFWTHDPFYFWPIGLLYIIFAMIIIIILYRWFIVFYVIEFFLQCIDLSLEVESFVLVYGGMVCWMSIIAVRYFSS